MPAIINDALFLSRQDLLAAGIKMPALANWAKRGLISETGIAYRSIPAASRAKLRPEEEYRQDIENSHRQDHGTMGIAQAVSQAAAEHIRFLSDFAGNPKPATKAAVLAWISADNAHTACGFSRKSEFFAALVAENQFVAATGISNVRVLQRALANIREKGLEICMPKYFGNKNRVKYSEWHQFLVEALYAMPMAYSARHILRFANERALQLGMTEFSLSWIEHYIAKPEVQNLAYESRYGKKAFLDRVRPYVPRLAAVYASDLWVMDGTRFNFSYDNGISKSFLNCYVVMDAMSRRILGWAFSEAGEDRWTVMSAIRMAVDGAGHAPYEILHDNAPAHSTEEFAEMRSALNAIGCSFRAAKVGNARDKVVERFFSSFDTTVSRLCPNWVGEGIKSKRKNARPAPEFQCTIKRSDLPDRAGLIIQISNLILDWNAQKLGTESPDSLFRLSEKPYAQACAAWLAASIFWPSTTVTIRNSMLKITVQHVEYVYEIDDYDVRLQFNTDKKRAATDVIVRYDDRDMAEVFLFSAANNEFLCKCKQYARPVGANAGQGKENGQEIAKQEAKNKAFERKMQEQRELKRLAAEKIADVAIPIELLTPASGKSALDNAESAALLELVYAREAINPQTVRPLAPISQPNQYIDAPKGAENQGDGLYFVPGTLKIIE
jgi:hypothetical protein